MPSADNKIVYVDFKKHANTDLLTTETAPVALRALAVRQNGEDEAASNSYADVHSLYDEAADTKLSNFLRILDTVIGHLNSCKAAIESDDRFVADAEFMEARMLLSELFMFRDLNDSVGLVVLRCFEVCQDIQVITDQPKVPQELLSSLVTLYHRPFMSFENALVLVESIKLGGDRQFPRIGGLQELIDLLLDETSEGGTEAEEGSGR